MKIGLSYSRCVRDIVDGAVNIDDVLVIIARTDFDPHNDVQWTELWQGYGGGTDNAYTRWLLSHSNPEWICYKDEDEDRLRSVSIELWESGRLHQPRQFGANPRRLPHIWLETVMCNDDLETNPAAKMAWDHFQTVSGLTGIRLEQHQE